MIWVALCLSALSTVAYVILVMDHARLDARVEVLEKEIIARVEKALSEKGTQQ